MAIELQWKDGEGYDIHVLREGPPSKALDNSFEIDPSFPLAQFPLKFVAHFKGAPNAHGVKVDAATGVVTAKAHPNPSQPKIRNFLVTAIQDCGGGDIFQSDIRVHIHDSVQKLWLTPSTLWIRVHPMSASTDADDYQLTVLALFDDDGVVGDITDWPQLSWTSIDPATQAASTDILVSAEGKLKAEPGTTTNKDSDIKVALKLSSPTTNVSAVAKAVVKESWKKLAENAQVKWVGGPLRPNENEIVSTNPNNVTAVVEGKSNILFVAEGFTSGREKDFTKAVASIVTGKTGLLQGVLEPFNLLKNSINYWSVFVSSREDGVSLLGDFEISGTGAKQRGYRAPLAVEPPQTATEWSVENMIHQLGLPAPKDPTLSVQDWISRWTKLYDAPVNEVLVNANFSDWNALRSRSPLNELDSVFGISNGSRARASSTGVNDTLLRPNLRRAKEDNILQRFIQNLQFGIPSGVNSDPYQIGDRWMKQSKDSGLVCFVCLSDVEAGEAFSSQFFAAATGYDRVVRLSDATNGTDIKATPLSDPSAPYSPDMLAGTVAHECGHALGLGDEYGPGNAALFTGQLANAVLFPNLQAKDSITSPGPGSSIIYDSSKIKWRWPRPIKVGVMAPVTPTALGGNDFKMQLVPGHAKAFNLDDTIMLRRSPVKTSDPFADIRFVVTSVGRDIMEVTWKSGPQFDPTLFTTSSTYLIVCTAIKGGVERKLISESVLTWIDASNGPLNAPASNPAAACVPSKNMVSVMTPTNLPRRKYNKKAPPAPADIIGVYEGGGHFDCGVFRPAGRCRMRTSTNKIVPFCQVCRYVIVDRIDPMKLVDLDKMYDPYYPTF